jgi:hypothetical protein
MEVVKQVTSDDYSKAQQKDDAQYFINQWFRMSKCDTLPMVLKEDKINDMLANRCAQDLGLMYNYNLFKE